MIKVKDNWSILDRAILALTKNVVVVGIPGGGARKDEGVDNSTLGYLHEFGAPERHIPARPFLVPGVESVQERIVSTYRNAGKAVLTGDFQAIETAHEKVGLIAQAAVQARIVSGPFDPLSERTLAARRARGVSRESPLIDTGQLRNSVQYMIKPKNRI